MFLSFYCGEKQSISLEIHGIIDFSGCCYESLHLRVCEFRHTQPKKSERKKEIRIAETNQKETNTNEMVVVMDQNVGTLFLSSMLLN